METCIICHEEIAMIDGMWTHTHSKDTYCYTGDGAVAYPSSIIPKTEDEK